MLTRAVRFVVHNWPLKIAAIGLATLLYAGFVVSRDQLELPGPIPIVPVGLPEDRTLLNELPTVTRIGYVAPSDVGRLNASDFQATVDLSNVPVGREVSVPVSVTSTVGGVFVVDVQPRTVRVTLDQVISRDVPVRIETTPLPAGVQQGEMVIDPPTVSVRGASSVVQKVDAVTATISIEPSAIDIDRVVEPVAVDAQGQTVGGVELDPKSVHVELPLFTNLESRGLPVRVVITGSPGPGYRVAGIDPEPSIVSVQGDADDLVKLQAVDTEPIRLNGETATVSTTTRLALPPNVTAPNVDTIKVTIRIEPVTETRTFSAGFQLVGDEPGFTYDLSTSRVLVTLFGGVNDLDAAGSNPLVATVDVTGLDAGVHTVTVTPQVPSGLTLVDTSPPSISVRVTSVAPSGSAGASASAGSSPPASAPASPSASP
jgi:YbbR domain-containing protein